jgi:hypothetical protein
MQEVTHGSTPSPIDPQPTITKRPRNTCFAMLSRAAITGEQRQALTSVAARAATGVRHRTTAAARSRGPTEQQQSTATRHSEVAIAAALTPHRQRLREKDVRGFVREADPHSLSGKKCSWYARPSFRHGHERSRHRPGALLQISGTVLLTRFYLRHLRTLFSLPLPLKNPEVLGDVMAVGKPFELRVPAAPARSYNADIRKLEADVKQLGPGTPLSFPAMFAAFLLIRAACIANAVMNPERWDVTVALGALQFVIMPYSLFVTITQLLAIAPALFVGHAVTTLPLTAITNALLPEQWRLYLPITPAFVWVFFIVDQLL